MSSLTSRRGLVNAFGVFQTYYERDLLRHKSPSDIAWIGALRGFLLIGVGVLSGPAFDAGYCKELLLAALFLLTFGHMMTSLCHEYWQVVLAQGLVVGLGIGCCFTPSVSLVPRYFSRKRSLASGLAAAGASVGEFVVFVDAYRRLIRSGGTIYPIVFRQLQSKIGFGWTVRTLGFIILATSGIAWAIVLTDNMQPRKRRLLFDFGAFRNVSFSLFTIGLFFIVAGIYIPTFYISTFAVQKAHMDTNLGFYLLPILNAGGVVGRILPSYFADKIGPMNVTFPTLAAAGILSFGWIGATHRGSLIVIAILYGYCSGTIMALPPPIVVSIAPGLEVLGTWMGTCFATAAPGLFIGNPVAGAILKHHSFVGLQVWCAVLLFAASAFVFGARIGKTGWTVFAKA